AILLSFVLAGFTVNQCFFAVTLFYLLLLRCLYPMPAWLRTGEKALKEGRYREAEKIFRDALRREIKRGSDDQIAMACFYLADTLKLQSKLSEAYTCYDRAIQIFQLHYGPRDPQVGHVLSMAIECALLSKQLEEVDVLYEKMISSGFLKGRGSLIRRARTLLCLAVSRQARGVEGSEVEKIATEAIEAFEEARLKPNDFYNFARFASDCLFSREAPLPGSSRLYRRIMAVRKKVVPGPLQRDLPARKVEESDTYHGVTVADPYRWLEDHKSREVMDWVDRNNERQLDFFARRPGQNPIETRWTGLDLDSIRTLPFFQEDKYYFNQIPMRGLLPVLYSLKRLDDDPRVVFDPNTWSINDSFDMRGGILSRCGRFVVYGIASDGTDWTELRLYDSYLGVELPDVVRWTRCGYPSWAKDSSGFFYTQFDRLTEGFAPGQPIRSPRVRFHTRGHSQDEDQVVYERPDDPDLLFSTIVTQDGSILFIFTENATANGNGMLLARTGSDPLSPVEVFPLGDSRYSP
ncbi:MAG: hypothetical protein K8F91_07770, partial [Candidatus Obscuribacterales bacterium]|nr:hypothetical protein [Candidatus Obscuribacterales bacterium]